MKNKSILEELEELIALLAFGISLAVLIILALSFIGDGIDFLSHTQQEILFVFQVIFVISILCLAAVPCFKNLVKHHTLKLIVLWFGLAHFTFFPLGFLNFLYPLIDSQSTSSIPNFFPALSFLSFLSFLMALFIAILPTIILVAGILGMRTRLKSDTETCKSR